MNERIVLVGGPCRGKSTYAHERHYGRPLYCTDTWRQARKPKNYAGDVSYMPEEVTDWSDQSQHVADHWLTLRGPWCIEGVATARALRKWADANPPGTPLPCDRVVVFRYAHPESDPTPGQERMAKGVWTVWQEIADRFASVVEYR